MQNGSKYVPPHLRNRCNGVPSVHVDNDKKSRVIGFDPNSVPPHLRNRVMQNGKHVPRNPVRKIDCNYVPPHLRNRLHGVPSKRENKTIEVTDDDRANLDADQGFDDTENADQVTESGNKNVVNNRADQEEATNTDTSDIATSGEDGFFSQPEAGCDEPSGNHIPTLGSLAKLGPLKIPSEIRTLLASSDIAADTTSDRSIESAIDNASEVTTDAIADESIDTSESNIATSGEDGFFNCLNISDDVAATADSEDLDTDIRNIVLYQGVKSECNQDTAIGPMGEDFMDDICSNSLGILPTGEENRARTLAMRIDPMVYICSNSLGIIPTLVMRIDLDQFRHASTSLCSDSFGMLPALEENRARSLISIDLDRLRHVSTFHKNMIASSKQGKMKIKSTMYDTMCDDEDRASDLVDDSDGNLQLNLLVTRNPFDEMTASDMKDKPIVYWRKERLVDLPLGDFAPQYNFDDMDISYQEDLHLLHTEMNASHVINQEIRKLTTGGYVLFLFVVSAVLWWLSKFKYGRQIMIGISLKAGDNMMTGQQHYTTNQTRHIDRTQRWKRTIIGDHIQYINVRDNPADGLTKTLGRIMHNEHVYRAMGLYGSPHKFGGYKNSHEENNRDQNEFNIG